MGGITTTLFQRPRDPQFNNTTLLLSGNFPTNGAQNNTFLDSSSNGFSITRNGNTTQGSFSPFSQTGWSSYNNSASNNNVGIYLNGQSDFAFGTGDFTIEMWVNLQSKSPGQVIYDSRPDGTQGLYPTIYVDGSTNQLKFFTNSADRITQTSTFTYNVWHHVVVTRTGTSTKMFVDGVQEGSTYTDSNNYINGALRPFTGDGVTPSPASNSYGVLGYISNLRVVKGSGPYQSAGSSITVPTSPLTPVTNTVLLTLQSNRFVDTNTQVAAKTINTSVTPSVQAFSPFVPSGAYTTTAVGGSGYFDGSGDYLTLADSTAWDLTGDYTIEMWVYPITTTNSLIGIGSYISPNNGLTLYYNTNKLELYVNGAAVLTGGSTIVKNQWNHIAVVRSGSSTNNTKLYLNGAQDGQGTNTTSFTGVAGNGVSINNDYANSYSANTGSCYMSGLRILNGAAQYTAAFTPPTAPPTAITNTSLLCNFTNAGIVDSTAKNVLETVGNAQISTAVSRFGGSSMSFDGTTDYVVEPTNVNFGYGTGDFTIEFWLRLNSTALQTVVSNLTSDTSLNPHTYIASGGSIRYYTSSADRITGATLSTNQWYHIAVCRSGTSTRLFIDGTQSGSTYTDSNNYGTTAPLGIGTYWASGTPNTANTLNGYIDDLRISKVARYTANFNVPTIGFTDR